MNTGGSVFFGGKQSNIRRLHHSFDSQAAVTTNSCIVTPRGGQPKSFVLPGLQDERRNSTKKAPSNIIRSSMASGSNANVHEVQSVNKGSQGSFM